MGAACEGAAILPALGVSGQAPPGGSSEPTRLECTLSSTALAPAVAQKALYATQKASMAGDKGSRGTTLDKDFEKLEANRLKNRKSAPKKADRNPDPKALGLKTYGGAYLGPRAQ